MTIRIAVLEPGHQYIKKIKRKTIATHLASLMNNMVQIDVYDIENNHYPKSVGLYDVFIIPGSLQSALSIENVAWIRRLSTYIKQVVAQKKPLIGICFGHQLITQTLGGELATNQRKCCVRHKALQFMRSSHVDLQAYGGHTMLYLHADQVTQLPDGALLLARTDHDEHTLYELNNHVLCMQFHVDLDLPALQAVIKDMNLDRSPVDQFIWSEIKEQPYDYKAGLEWLADWIKANTNCNR